MPRYGTPDMEIERVQISKNTFYDPTRAEVTVTVGDRALDSGTSGYNAFYAHVYSQDLTQSIISYCGIIQPGQSMEVDESSGDIEGYNGEFPLESYPVNVTVDVGPMEIGTNCRPSNLSGMPVDETVSEQITISSSNLLSNMQISIDNVETSPGEAVMTYSVQNNNGIAVDASIGFGDGLGGDTIPLDANSAKTLEATFFFDYNVDTDVEICANLVTATSQ